MHVQPIERMWGNAKNPIGRDPAKTMSELLTRMRAGFDQQGMKLFFGCWRRMQETEEVYWAQVAIEQRLYEADHGTDAVDDEADDPTDLAEEIEEQMDE